jgi:hypothetical protein
MIYDLEFELQMATKVYDWGGRRERFERLHELYKEVRRCRCARVLPPAPEDIRHLDLNY